MHGCVKSISYVHMKWLMGYLDISLMKIVHWLQHFIDVSWFSFIFYRLVCSMFISEFISLLDDSPGGHLGMQPASQPFIHLKCCVCVCSTEHNTWNSTIESFSKHTSTLVDFTCASSNFCQPLNRLSKKHIEYVCVRVCVCLFFLIDYLLNIVSIKGGSYSWTWNSYWTHE